MVSYQVVTLHGRQLVWKIWNHLTRLLNHSPNVGIGHICPHHKRLARNRYMKDWWTHKGGLEAVKCRLLDSRPVLNLTFSKKVQQGGSNKHKIVHILAIVISQTKKLLYMSGTSGHGTFTNSRQLGQVHVDLAMANYVAQIIDLALKKCIFLHFLT